MGRDWKEQRTAFHLVTGAMGLALAAMPWVFDGVGGPLAIWSAVFAGALVMRLGFSAALTFCEWKVWAEAAVGAWLLAVPWLQHWDGQLRLTCAHVIVGAAVVAVAAAEIRHRKGGRTPLRGSRAQATQPC